MIYNWIKIIVIKTAVVMAIVTVINNYFDFLLSYSIDE